MTALEARRMELLTRIEELYGELAALLNLANEHPPPRNGGVAGARNQRYLHLDLAIL
jgi:hypothetical protein